MVTHRRARATSCTLSDKNRGRVYTQNIPQDMQEAYGGECSHAMREDLRKAGVQGKAKFLDIKLMKGYTDPAN